MSAALVEPHTEDRNGMATYPIDENYGGNLGGGKIEFVQSSLDDNSSGTFHIKQEGHTLGNALRWMLMKDPAVEFAGYTIPHPSEFVISIRVQTNGMKSAVDAFHDAIDNLMDMTSHIKEKFSENVTQFTAAEAAGDQEMR